MSTPHNEANIGDIAKTVIMPGDPLRAKYIAENFLENAKLVNQVRGMYAYTRKLSWKRSNCYGFWNGNAKYGNLLL